MKYTSNDIQIILIHPVVLAGQGSLRWWINLYNRFISVYLQIQIFFEENIYICTNAKIKVGKKVANFFNKANATQQEFRNHLKESHPGVF